MNWPVKSQRVLLQGAWMYFTRYLTASCVHHSLVSTIYNWWVSVFGNLKVDNVGKYLENFLGVDTVYSDNERSERQLARLVSRAALLCCAVLDAAAKLQGPSHPGSRAHSVQQPGLWVGDTTVQAGWREDCSYYRCILSSAVYYDTPCVDWWYPPGQVAHISR